jgi:translation initiation factor IF-1
MNSNIEIEGIVETVGRGQVYIVRSVLHNIPVRIVAKLSGKMRRFNIRVVKGDVVKVVVNKKDPTNGRIVYRKP